MPFVNVYYHENKLNKEEIKKVGECISQVQTPV